MLDADKMASMHSVGDGLSTGSMAAVTPNLSLNTVPPHMSPGQSELSLPSLSPGRMIPNNIFCAGPLRGQATRYLAVFSLSRANRIPADFNSHMLCELLFGALVIQAREPWNEVEMPHSS